AGVAAAAAAAADRLREDALAEGPVGIDDPAVRERDVATPAAHARAAADRDQTVPIAAIAPAAADRLRIDAAREAPVGVDPSRVAHRHGLAASAGTAAAAQRKEDAPRRGAGAAAAADRLRDDPVGTGARGVDDAGRTERDGDFAAVGTAAAA